MFEINTTSGQGYRNIIAFNVSKNFHDVLWRNISLSGRY
jgi:hypothetical protein